MQAPQTPPPLPYMPRTSFGMKVLYLAMQGGVLMVAAFIIWLFAYSRQDHSESVARQISSEWAGEARISGPEICIVSDTATVRVLPQELDCRAVVDSRTLHRNIYEAEVYDARITVSASFRRRDIRPIADSTVIELRLDTRAISEIPDLVIGCDTMKWQYDGSCFFAPVYLADMPEIIHFSTAFNMRGSQGLHFKALAQRSHIAIEGEAGNPSFTGMVLPEHRNIDGRAFDASWQINCIHPADSLDERAHNGYVGTRFLVGVDHYRKVERVLKYAFFIILLTYICILFTEIYRRRELSLVNYFLIGAALIIFYTLLLSFTEHMPFGTAYLLAAIMTDLLIAVYVWRMFRSAATGALIGAVLAVLYTVVFVMLVLSTYALLVGSLILFASLAAVMAATLRLPS